MRRIERQEAALGADRRSIGHRAHARVFSLGAGEYACQARVEVRDSPASHGAPRTRPLPRLQHAHCIARISGPRAYFAAGQLPTFLRGPGAHNAGRSARVIFFILNSTLGTLGSCCAARQAAMASSLLDPERRMPTAHARASHATSRGALGDSIGPDPALPRLPTRGRSGEVGGRVGRNVDSLLQTAQGDSPTMSAHGAERSPSLRRLNNYPAQFQHRVGGAGTWAGGPST